MKNKQKQQKINKNSQITEEESFDYNEGFVIQQKIINEQSKEQVKQELALNEKMKLMKILSEEKKKNRKIEKIEIPKDKMFIQRIDSHIKKLKEFNQYQMEQKVAEINEQSKIEKQQKQLQRQQQSKTNKGSGEFRNFHIISQWQNMSPEINPQSNENFKLQDSVKREKNSQQQSTEYLHQNSNQKSIRLVQDQTKKILTFGLPSPKETQQKGIDSQKQAQSRFVSNSSLKEQTQVIINPDQSPKIQYRIQQNSIPQVIMNSNSFEISPQIKQKGQFLRMQKPLQKKSSTIPKIIKKKPFINENLGSLSMTQESINKDVIQVLKEDLLFLDLQEEKQMQKSSSINKIVSHSHSRLLSQETYQRKESNLHFSLIKRNRENKVPNEDLEETFKQDKSNDDYKSQSKNNSSKIINHHQSNISGSVNTNQQSIRKVLTIVTNHRKQNMNQNVFKIPKNDTRQQTDDNSESIAPENVLQSINSRSGTKFQEVDDNEKHKQSFDTIKIGPNHGILKSEQQLHDIQNKTRWDSQPETFVQGSIYENNQNYDQNYSKSKQQIGKKFKSIGDPSDNQSFNSLQGIHNHEKTLVDTKFQSNQNGQNAQFMKQIHLDIGQLTDKNQTLKRSKKKLLSDLKSDKQKTIQRGEHSIRGFDEENKDSMIEFNEDTYYRRTEINSGNDLKIKGRESKLNLKNNLIIPAIKNQIIYSPSIPLFQGSQVLVNHSNEKNNKDILNDEELPSNLKINQNQKQSRKKIHHTEITYQMNKIETDQIQLPNQIKNVANILKQRLKNKNIFVKGIQNPNNDYMFKIELKQNQVKNESKELKQKKVSIEFNIKNIQQADNQPKKQKQNLQLQTTQFIQKEQPVTQNGELTTVFLSRNLSNNLQNSNSLPFQFDSQRQFSQKSLNKTIFIDIQENQQLQKKYSENKMYQARMIASETNLTVQRIIEDQTLEHSPSVPKNNLRIHQQKDKSIKENSPFQILNKKSARNSFQNSDEDILDKVIRNDPSIMQIQNGMHLKQNEQSYQNLTTQYHQKVYSLGSIQSYSSKDSQFQDNKAKHDEKQEIKSKKSKKQKVSQLELARKKIEQMQKESNLFNNNNPMPVKTNYAINELISGKSNPNQNICRITKEQLLQIQQFKKQCQLEEIENRKKEFIRLKNIIESRRCKSQLEQKYIQNQDLKTENEEKERLDIQKQKSLKKLKEYRNIVNKIFKEREVQQIENENKKIQAMILKHTLLLESNLENNIQMASKQFPEIDFNKRKSSIDYIDTQIYDLIRNQQILQKRNSSVSKTVDHRQSTQLNFDNQKQQSQIQENNININNLTVQMRMNNEMNSDYQTINLNSPVVYSPNRPIQQELMQANTQVLIAQSEIEIKHDEFLVQNETHQSAGFQQKNETEKQTTKNEDGISVQNNFAKTSKLVDQNQTKGSIVSPWVIGTKLTPINASMTYSILGSEGKEQPQQQHNKQSSTQLVIRNIFINKLKNFEKENKTLQVNKNIDDKKKKQNIDKEIIEMHKQIIQENQNRTSQINDNVNQQKFIQEDKSILPEIISKITKQQNQSKYGSKFKSKSTFSRQNRAYQTIEVNQEIIPQIQFPQTYETQIEQKTPNLDNIKHSLFQKQNSPKNQVKLQNSDLKELENPLVQIEQKQQLINKTKIYSRQIRNNQIIKKIQNRKNKKDECEQIDITSKRSSIQQISKKDNSSFLQSPIDNLHPILILQEPQQLNDQNIIIKKRSSLPIIYSKSNHQTFDSNGIKTNQETSEDKNEIYLKQQTKKINNQLNLQKIQELMNQVQIEEQNEMRNGLEQRNSEIQSIQSTQNYQGVQDSNFTNKQKRNSIKSIDSNISSQQFQLNTKNGAQNPVLQILKFENQRSKQNILENNQQQQQNQIMRNKDKQIELYKQNFEVLKELGLIKNEEIIKQIEDKIVNDLKMKGKISDYQNMQTRKRNENISKTQMSNYGIGQGMSQQPQMSKNPSMISSILTANNSSLETITPIQKHLIQKQLLLKRNESENDFQLFNFKNIATPSTFLQSPNIEQQIKFVYN